MAPSRRTPIFKKKSTGTVRGCLVTFSCRHINFCSRVHQNTPFSFQKLPPPSNPKYATELDELDMWSTVMVMMMMMQVTSLYVEDPARTRIMQWTNITNADGM